MKLRISFLILLVSLCLSGYTQSIERYFAQAEKNIEEEYYPQAINVYNYIKNNFSGLQQVEIRKANLGIAHIYYIQKDYINSEKYYEEALKSFPRLKGEEIEAYKRYAQVLASLKKYEVSEKYWDRYNELINEDGLSSRARYDKIGPLQRNQNAYIIEYLKINSGFPDFSPVYYNSGLVFVSGRERSKIVRRVFGLDNANFLDLYYLNDLSLLEKSESSAAVLGTGQQLAQKVSSTNTNVDTGFFTVSTPNDTPVPGRGGGPGISGKPTYIENPTIPTEQFSRKLNSKYHEGPAVFFNNDKHIIFTRNAPSRSNLWNTFSGKETTRLKLFEAEMSGNKWVNITPLELGDDQYSYGHPAITKDGKVLYFVSDMPGGYGGTDIYYSVYENGSWGKPVKDGSEINTGGNEMFPFIDDNGQLYFSSDGQLGLGGLDIFVIQLTPDKLEAIPPIRNLGAPINSPFDDFGIITDIDRKEGFFSSNRKRGGNDDDIYKFTRIGLLYGCRDLVVTITDSIQNLSIPNFKFGLSIVDRQGSYENFTTNSEGFVNLCLEADQKFILSFEKEGYESKRTSYENIHTPDSEVDTVNVFLNRIIIEEKKFEEPFIGQDDQMIQSWSGDDNTGIFKAIITDASGNPIEGALVKFINRSDHSIQEVYTDSIGIVEFYRNLECEYELLSEKDGFTISKDIIPRVVEKNIFGRKRTVSKADPNELFNSKLYKVGDVIRLPNIYYITNEYKLSREAKAELDNLINVMKKYPYMAIEVSSHTDSRGNVSVNQELSQKRANEVLNYLAKSIDRGRIRAIGKGESEPVNNCGDGVQCTESEHAKNRRTEFKVLRMEKI